MEILFLIKIFTPILERDILPAGINTIFHKPEIYVVTRHDHDCMCNWNSVFNGTGMNGILVLLVDHVCGADIAGYTYGTQVTQVTSACPT